MRLVSQDGEVDVPYEHGSLCIGFIKGEEHIINTISYYNYSCQIGTKLAEYSSKAKALKVMEMLRKAYSQFEITKIVACGSSEQISKQLTQKEAEIVISDFWEMATFQFPKDEEVEV